MTVEEMEQLRKDLRRYENRHVALNDRFTRRAISQILTDILNEIVKTRKEQDETVERTTNSLY